jgi:gamma-glutamyltranspeptidase
VSAAAGHAVLLRGGNAVDAATTLGGVQVILRDPLSGALRTGADPYSARNAYRLCGGGLKKGASGRD